MTTSRGVKIPDRQPVTRPGGDVERRAAVFTRALDVVVGLDQWPAEEADLAAVRVARHQVVEPDLMWPPQSLEPSQSTTPSMSSPFGSGASTTNSGDNWAT